MIFSFLQNSPFKDFFSRFRSESNFLGIDIGTSSIKVIELRKEKERPILQTYGELSLARYSESEGSRSFALVDDRLKEALIDVLRESQTKSHKAIVSIPLKNSFITMMSMPHLAENELKEAISYEARKYIPIPISEAMIDWWVLPPGSTEAGDASIGSVRRELVNVLLVAVPNEVIAKYKNIFSGSGIEIESFEIESFSSVRAGLHQEGGVLLMLDLGASSTKMTIIDGGVARSAHSIEQGGWMLTQALQQSLGLDFARAEMLKRDFGIVRKPETQGAVSVLEPLIDALSSEAERFLLDWRRHGGKPISRVLLSGGGALLKGIDQHIIKKLGVEAKVINPFSKVVYPAFLEPALKEIGATFANAVGLALHNF